MKNERAPAPLRDRIAADLAPVTPLRKPWLRAACALPLGVLLLFAASTLYSLRADAGRLGWTLTWGLSTVELALGMLLIGFALRHYGYPMAPLVLGIVLGDLLEKNLRRALILSDGDLTPFFTRPIAGTVAALIVATIAWRVWSLLRRPRVASAPAVP